MLSDAERDVLNRALEQFRPGQTEPIFVGGPKLLRPALRLMSLYRLRFDEIKGDTVVTSFTRWLECVQVRGSENQEVYVIGEMTDWRLRDEFKMEYDESSHTYFCNPLLKQGYYNYAFSVVDAETYEPSPEEDMEGDWHETGNLYTIFIYYRPFGQRYDRLMTVGGIDSRTAKK